MEEMVSPLENNFSVLFSRKINYSFENFFISPLSMKILLAMVYQGADGETAEELAAILAIESQKKVADKSKPLVELLKKTETIAHLARKIFIMKNFHLKKNFDDVIRESFLAKIDMIDFSNSEEAAGLINQWVTRKTNENIKNIISQCYLNESTRMVLVDTCYFGSTWLKPFNPEDTTQQCFSMTEQETVDCEMMFISDMFNCRYGILNRFADLIEIPCIDNIMNMIIILPRAKIERYYGDSEEDEDVDEDINEDVDDDVIDYRKRLEKLQAKLIVTNIHELLDTANMKKCRVDLYLPKFRIEMDTNVKPILEDMNIEIIAEPDFADFSNISENPEPLHVSQIIQKTLIEIKENGNEPGALTENLPEIQCEDQVKDFFVNRPFIYMLVTHAEWGSVAWAGGKVLNPGL